MIDPQPYDRLALAGDLHLTRTGHLVTVATSRWEPGIFFYDVEYLTVDVRSKGAGYRITLSGRGANPAFQVLHFELDQRQFAVFELFIGQARHFRDRLRAGGS